MTNNKQQTAVDYIFSQLPAEYGTTRSAFDVYQQAKEMEKEQIAKAFDDGDYNYHYSRKTGNDFEDGQEYFNEIYK
jgi:dihydrofolate reductase